MNSQPLKAWPFYLKLACVLLSLIALCGIVIVAKELLSPLIFSCLFAILLCHWRIFWKKD